MSDGMHLKSEDGITDTLIMWADGLPKRWLNSTIKGYMTAYIGTPTAIFIDINHITITQKIELW